MSNEPCVIGIDPGFSGGLVALSLDGRPLASTAMPKIKAAKGNDLHTLAIMDWFDLIGNGAIRLAVMERSHAREVDKAPQAFKVGWYAGKLCGLIEGLRLPLELVMPRQWQTAIIPGVNGDNTVDTKSRSIAYVKRRWPTLNLRATPKCRTDHDGIADAACIAEWARRRIVGNASLIVEHFATKGVLDIFGLPNITHESEG